MSAQWGNSVRRPVEGYMAQDIYTVWRRMIVWNHGVVGRAKRTMRHQERAQQHQELIRDLPELLIEGEPFWEYDEDWESEEFTFVIAPELRSHEVEPGRWVWM